MAFKEAQTCFQTQ